MQKPITSSGSSPSDRRDARRFMLIVILIALAATILLVMLITPSAIQLHIVWPPMIALITLAVRLYFRPRQ